MGQILPFRNPIVLSRRGMGRAKARRMRRGRERTRLGPRLSRHFSMTQPWG